MIPFEQALELVLGSCRALDAERVPLTAADGRALTRAVRARLDHPRFDQSSMDGVAVRRADLPGTLRLIAEMPAGTSRRPRLRPGTAVRVFTGSPLPSGADAVVMQERCVFKDGSVTIDFTPDAGACIRPRGGERRRGDLLLAAGTALSPASIGLLAGDGSVDALVFRRPVVTLITMGDEIARAGERLGPGQVRDALGPALTTALSRAGAASVRHRHAADDPGRLTRLLRTAVRSSDLVVTCGGASVGDHDHVAEARRRLDVHDLFDRVAVKPGKPTIFGHAPDGTPVFGLPGNPVSALVTFQLFVEPAMRAMQGLPADPITVEATLAADLHKKPGRLEWVRGVLDRTAGVVTPLAARDSHMIGGLAAADVLIPFPAEAERLAKGRRVRVRVMGEWS